MEMTLSHILSHELQKLASNHSNIKLKQLDVTDVKSIEGLAESVTADLGDDGLNLLVNNAGRLRRLQLGEVTEEFMIDSFRVNTLGPLLMSQAFVPLLKKAATKSQTDGLSCDKAAIINISTLTSSLSDNRSGGNYDSRITKAALNMVTKNLSVDLKDSGILVVSMDPGWVKTDMGSEGAKMGVEESIGKMLNQFSRLSAGDTGTFINYNGKPIPW